MASTSKASANSNWPPSLKAYVNETFAKCTDSNRVAVEAELKGLILRAFQNNALWTTDWPSVKLESLNPKKRKTFVPSTPLSHGVGTAAVAAEDDRRLKRAKRFDASSPTSSSTPSMASRIAARGVNGFVGIRYTPPVGTPEPDAVYDPNVLDWDRHTIVGTSTKLEKPYLRLTTLPDPTTIRPLPILKQTLELLKKKWKEEGNYAWVSDQFKSMRQDLTVQRIKNDFTCAVYEIHARIALEKGELGEFNQCQGQLRELYRVGLKGHNHEFLAYRILYLIYSRNRAEMNSTLAAITSEERRDPSVAHALAVRQAVSQGNYTTVFRLFAESPKMGAYVMDHFVPRERVQALVVMTKAYQQVPLSLIVSQLAFESAEEAESFLDNLSANTFLPSASLGSDKLLSAKAAAPPLLEALAKFTREAKVVAAAAAP